MTMRLLDDRKLTKLLENHYEVGCIGCAIDGKCNGQAKESVTINNFPKSKRACFKALREFLTPGEEK